MTTNFALFIYSSSRQHVRIQPFNEISENCKGFTLITKFLRSFQTTTIRDRKVKLSRQHVRIQPFNEISENCKGFTLITKFLRSFQTTTIRDRKVKLQLFIVQAGW